MTTTIKSNSTRAEACTAIAKIINVRNTMTRVIGFDENGDVDYHYNADDQDYNCVVIVVWNDEQGGECMGDLEPDNFEEMYSFVDECLLPELNKNHENEYEIEFSK